MEKDHFEGLSPVVSILCGNHPNSVQTFTTKNFPNFINLLNIYI